MNKFNSVLKYAYLGGGLVLIGVGIFGSVWSLKKEVNRYKDIEEINKTNREWLQNELKMSEERLKRYTNSYESYGENLGEAD